MLEFSDVAVAHAVQLAVAPVFLLTGISAFLTVMTNRLGRVIDRARILEERLETASPESVATLRADLAAIAAGQTQRPRDHAVHGDGAARVHGDRGAVSERLPSIRCIDPSGPALRRGDVVFLSWPLVVPARDLSGHQECAHRRVELLNRRCGLPLAHGAPLVLPLKTS